jgi:hypothetical protein
MRAIEIIDWFFRKEPFVRDGQKDGAGRLEARGNEIG